MMASDHDGTENRTDTRTRVSRYDLVLAVIPTAFLLAAIASQFVSVPTHTLVAGATTIGALALADGLFINPPRSGTA